MKVIQVKHAQEGGKQAFAQLKEAMDKGITTLGLATGSTPVTLYQEMVTSALDFSHLTSVNLDEYVGLSGENPQSYRYFMNEHLFNKKPFKETFVPNGQAKDLDEECARYNDIIAQHPIDLQVLGIGRNGHIGFNEPGTSFDVQTHVVALTDSTIEANKRYFDSIEEVPTHALSMGIASILKSKQIILMAFGKEKAAAVAKMIEGPVTEQLPASVLQMHPNVIVIVDEQAASELTK
ncbi:MAG: glucosamine-6-phosphate deaminase [Enterococcus italicus]|uniref:Glucosamine-6-phosphate deaminase n=1 Tax=Enterococcus italicus (strain DSM 15952 / CCUG 50447 / LMG 22039 / TP 1.5) TaxID=888064 RepID=E6LDQ6_ENTI1|nr:glucosamine-6-phosphate deaminase [Enterococcus italicus]EFU74645.1 glucosamine-6-phosphate deaminase [Enterococcus italicus DSM 15952]OJG58996.1 glucosamine-6-phosphate deaminase [Enterococcus italicus DSM 15952]